MIPYILAAVGGYLIGDALNAKLFAKGGKISKTKKAFGALDFEQLRQIFGVNLFGLNEEKTEIILDELREEWYEKTENERKEILLNYSIDYDEFAGGGKVDMPSIDEVREEGEFIDSYMIDESQTVSNAGEQESYIYKGRNYLITTWNERAENHKNGEEEIAVSEEFAKGGKVKWIQDALDGNTKGALRATAKRKGLLRGDENLSKTDLKKLQKMGGKTAKRAHLAETLSKF